VYRFLLSPRWVGLLVFALFMTVACVWLGGWQWDRYHQRQAENDVTRNNYQAEPIPVERALSDGWSPKLDWRTVTATGTFLPEHQVTVRFAHRDSRTGVEVVTPMRLDSGDIVLVQRGWAKSDNSGGPPDDITPPPEGQVTVTGWLQPDSTANRQATTPRDGEVRAIASSRWDDELGTEALPGFVAMTSPEQEGLESAQEPDLGSGPSGFYAVQWYFFAGLAVFGYYWFVRTEVRERRQAAAAQPVG